MSVEAYPGPGSRAQISTQGGTEPVWARTSRELFYRTGNQMLAVDVTTVPSFEAGRPRVLFEAACTRFGVGTNHDVTHDGQRFVMIRKIERPPVTELPVVQNWFEELKRLVPMQ